MSNVIALNNVRNEERESALPKANLVRRVLRHPYLMPYNRLAIGVVLANLLWAQRQSDFTSSKLLWAILINFTVATLIRQQYVINFLFEVATSTPKSFPLWFRHAMGKVYHFGGIHVGGFFSGSLWLGLYTYNQFRAESAALSLKLLLSFHLVILLTMMIAALPHLRARYHNQFEIIARFGLWTSIALFWAQLFMTNAPLSAFVVLSLVTLSVILPWLRLKKINIEYTRPSNHVVLANFDYGVTPFAGSSTDLSLSPLLEWHSFANVPLPGRTGFKLTISRAGDWTGELIDKLPKKIWVKGIPTAGVGNVEKLFKKVVWVATGSGIGPCLPHLFSGEVPASLVWATRDPRKTYGDELVEEILRAQPDALIWDTDRFGKPNLAKLAYEAVQKTGAEAVICISNKKVTWFVNHELESLGIPAFGAIWDS